MKRDMVNLIEADEVRERVGVFLVGKTREGYTKADNRCESQQLALLALAWSQLSRVEVTLENDDVDLGELSRLASLHLGLADVKDAFHRFKISKLYSSFLKWKVEKWPLWLDACALVSAACRWVTLGVYFLSESNRRGNVGHS